MYEDRLERGDTGGLGGPSRKGVEVSQNIPKHVLLPPVTKSHHSSGLVASGLTRLYSVSFQLSSVRISICLGVGLASGTSAFSTGGLGLGR